MTPPRGQAIRLDMTMSLDGFVVGPRDSVDAPMGIGGFRLFNWLDHRLDPGPNGQVFGEIEGDPCRDLRPPHLRAR